MSTEAASSSSLYSPPKPPPSQRCIELANPPYELHCAVFNNDLGTVKGILNTTKDAVNVSDKHGNTPLHLAVMLGNKIIIHYLLEMKSSVKEKNGLGWTALSEAISYGDREIIAALVKRLRDEISDGLIQRRFDLIQALRNLDDFYAELKWEFHTWVPFLSRLLPSDVCRIHKTGCCIRLDSSLGDFTEMQWSRGDISFIFNGEDTRNSNTLSLVALDNKKEAYQRLSLSSGQDVEVEFDEQIDMLMSRPIMYANMSTKPITVVRAQSGYLFFKGDKTEQVGEYMTDVYDIGNLVLISRKRREHLTPEQISRSEEIARKVENGEITEEMLSEDENGSSAQHRTSLPPPPSCEVTWDEYISAPRTKYPSLGRVMDVKIDRKHYNASICVTKHCPIELKKLLDILEVIAPYKHFYKLRQFVNRELPSGFPVKVEVPMFPTVTAIVTLQHYKPQQSAPSKFLIPRHYTKMKKEGGETSSSN